MLHRQNPEDFVQALTRAEAGIRLHGLYDGFSELKTLWGRHVSETEESVFQALLAQSPAADGLVGFFLAEHADLSARLTTLAQASPSVARSQATIQLIHRLIQHVLLEGRVLPPGGSHGTPAGADASVGAV